MDETLSRRLSWAIAFAVLLWLCSFFLPTLTFPPDNSRHWAPADGMQRGYDAALLSFIAGLMAVLELADTMGNGHFSWVSIYHLMDGVLWLANVWMIVAPFRAKSLLRGRSTPLLVTMWLWVAAPLPLAWNSFQRLSDGARPYTLHVGFLLWWFSLLLMALTCTAIRSHRSAEMLPYPPPRNQVYE